MIPSLEKLPEAAVPLPQERFRMHGEPKLSSSSLQKEHITPRLDRCMDQKEGLGGLQPGFIRWRHGHFTTGKPSQSCRRQLVGLKWNDLVISNLQVPVGVTE